MSTTQYLSPSFPMELLLNGFRDVCSAQSIEEKDDAKNEEAHFSTGNEIGLNLAGLTKKSTSSAVLGPVEKSFSFLIISAYYEVCS